MQRQEYTDLKKGEKEDLVGFLSNSYLSSKQSLCKIVDTIEDNFLNVYVFGLLHKISKGQFSDFERRYVSDFPQEVYSFVQQSLDPRFRFYVYKANADYRLVKLGLFGAQSQVSSRNKNIEITKRYYSFASAFLPQIPNLKSHLFIGHTKNIFDLLDSSLDVCLEILGHMATEQFNLLNFHVSDNFLEDIINRGELAVLRQRYYSKWDQYFDCKEKIQRDKLSFEITCLAQKIKEIEPSFNLPKFKKENL